MIQGIEEGVKLFSLVSIPKPVESQVKRTTISKKIKKKLFESQNGRCVFCECKMHRVKTSSTPPPDFATVEHVLPLMKGGTNDIENLVMSCYECNTIRGPQCFMAFVIRRNSPKLWDPFIQEYRAKMEARRRKKKLNAKKTQKVSHKVREEENRLRKIENRRIHAENMMRVFLKRQAAFEKLVASLGSRIYTGVETQTLH